MKHIASLVTLFILGDILLGRYILVKLVKWRLEQQPVWREKYPSTGGDERTSRGATRRTRRSPGEIGPLERREEDPCEGTASEMGAEPMEMGGE